MTSISTRAAVAAIVATACLAIPPSASATQPQSASKQTQSVGALAHERYYSSYGEPDTIDAGTSAAQTQERYYSSHGKREPPTVAQSPAPSNHTPRLPIALSVAVALAIVAASTTEVRKLAGRFVLAVPLITRLPAPLVLAACALMVTAGCGSRDEHSTRKSASVRAEATPSPDLASRVVEGDELVGFRLIGADGNDVQTDPGSLSARHQGLYAKPAEAVIALRRDGFVAGTGKRFDPGQRQGSAESIAVQMRDAKGAGAEAKQQFNAAFAPCPGEPKCATEIERFEVPRVP